MRTWILFLALLQPQDPKREEAYLKKVQRANQAIDWLLDSDEELRAAGRKTLLELGSDAVPFLEQKLTDKGVQEIYRILRELYQKESPPERRWLVESDLPKTEELEKEAPEVPQDHVDKYVYSKLYETYLLARKGNYQKAMDIAGAILTLEPKSPYGDQLRKLRRYCDIRITQTTLCEAKAIPAKGIAVAGEKVDVTLRIQNLLKSPVTLSFGEEGQGFAIVEYAIRIPTPKGDVHEMSKSDETRFDREIVIAPGGAWEHKFLVDTGTGLETGPDLQIYTVQPWMQPRKIDLGTAATARRIVFEPAVLKVVPKKYEKDLKDPLEALGRYMDKGTVNDVFVMAMVLEKDDREKGIELLIGALREAKRPEGRSFLCQLLTFVTEQKLGPDPRKWIDWWGSRSKGKNP